MKRRIKNELTKILLSDPTTLIGDPLDTYRRLHHASLETDMPDRRPLHASSKTGMPAESYRNSYMPIFIYLLHFHFGIMLGLY